MGGRTSLSVSLSSSVLAGSGEGEVMISPDRSASCVEHTTSSETWREVVGGSPSYPG